MKNEKTFIAIKAEALQRHLIGEIIKRFEQRGLKLVGLKLIKPTKEHVGSHYPNDEKWLKELGGKALKGAEKRGRKIEKTPLEMGKWVREMLIENWEGKPAVAMVWQGAHAVELGRKTVGSTSPLDAQPGTIRGDFTVDSYQLADSSERIVRNLVHAAGSVEEAEREIGIWFTEDEILDYPLTTEEVLYGDDWGR